MKFKNLYKIFVGACIVGSAVAGHSQVAVQTLHGQVRTEVAAGKAIPTSLMQPSQQMHLSIVLPLRNQAELKSLLGSLYDPSSSNYHKFLTAQQFTDQFAPTFEDYQTVVAYAQANGFTVGDAPANRLVVPITGTVAQVQKAFNVRMALYQHPTENRQFFSPDREPTLNLSVPVAHIAGLDNFSVPKPMYERAQPMGNTHYVTEGSGPGGSFLASDMRWAYYGGTALTGAGQTIALLEFDGYDKSDVDLTFSSAGQSYTVPVKNVLLDGATGANISGNDSEEVLDIVQAIGMAPGLSQVRVYIGGNDVDILNSIAAENVAQEVSISWSWSPDDPETDDLFFQEMAAQGQSVFASSGDWGEFDPAFDNFFPAEDAYVTAVGGTDLNTQGGGGPWASETAWNRSGGGISPDGIPIPSWQVGVATSTNGGSNTLRNVPDVAMQADFVNYSCANGACAGNYGGTSFSAPRWAAFTALINEQAVSGGNQTVGFINPAIYAIGEGTDYTNDFHDITYGNNDARNNCCGWPYYNAVPGYDLVTGWGSPNGQNLIDQLAPPAAAGFMLAPSASILTATPGSTGNINIAVSDKGGFSAPVTLSTPDLPAGVTATWGTNPTSSGSALTLQVAASVARGSYLISVDGVSGSLTASASFVLQINAAGFSIAPSPANLSIYPGTSNSTTILISDYAGFNGAVNLAVTSGLPSGVTASWSTNPSTNSSVLTLTADNTAAPNTDALITIAGTSGSITATTSLALVVNQPTFYVNMSPYPSTIAQGSSITTTVTVTGVPAGRTSDTIQLSAPELPSGVTASFNPARITLGQSSTLTLTASASAPTGTSLAGIDAQGTSAGTLTQFPLTVTAGTTPSFTLAVSQPAPTVTQGNTVSDMVSITAQNGFNSSVSLAISPSTPLPGGVTASFAPSTATTSSQLTFTASSSAIAGFYPLQVVGTSGTLTSVANVYLTVNPPALFTLSAAPASVSVTQYSSATDTITLNPQSGFSGSVALSIASALPAGVTASLTQFNKANTSTLTVNASGSATPGNYSITLAGSASGHTITLTVPLIVSAATSIPTTTSLSIAPTGPLIVGSAFMLTAHVAPTSGTAIPTGSVVFNIGGAPVSATLDATGTATYTTNAPTSTGNLAIAAAYQGTSVFEASSSNTLNVDIVGGTTTTAISISPIGGSLTAGSTFTLTATVTPQTGSGTPTGSVIFQVGTSQYPTTLNASGVATYTGTAPNATGTIGISAAYQGSATYAPSTSVTLNETIVAIATTTALTISPTGGTLTAGSSYTLTATVTPASGTAIPTGNVLFTIGSVTQSVALNSAGVATLTATAPTTPGSFAISAAYQGANPFAPSNSITLNELVANIATNTALTISPNVSSLASGSSFTLTATVTPQTGTAIPAGNVIFTLGSTTQSVPLNASGVAAYTATAPATAGTLAISAAYQGQGGFSSSTSATLTETIYAGTTPAFALASTAVTLNPGATTGNTSTITITPSNGFTGGVTLTASIANSPAGAQNLPTLSFVANSVNINSSSQASTNLIITTTAATTSASNTQPHSGINLYASGAATLACLLLFGIPARRRAWQRFLALVVLTVAFASGAIGCSSSFKLNNPNPGSTGTTPGLYLITVKGASGSTTATTTVSLTVQ